LPKDEVAERYEENVFWIGGNYGHTVTEEEIEWKRQEKDRLANEFRWMWGNWGSWKEDGELGRRDRDEADGEIGV
jgi:phage gp29-like protein